MRLIQFEYDGALRVGYVVDAKKILPLEIDGGTHALALAAAAAAAGQNLSGYVNTLARGAPINYHALIDEHRLLPPLTHPDPARLLVSGTGLTHLGSASSRAAMHTAIEDGTTVTDSMKMFRNGVLAGKPHDNQVGFQPEWFYKGDGDSVVSPGQPLPVPAFAEDAGEEPELAGLYVIDRRGQPIRIGFALGNEFSDHVTEKFNYLWLAHSKLRACSYGPELLVGALPASVQGHSRIRRGDTVLWERPFLTGEEHMCHSFANLEHHHFKYPQHRRPGDAHVHFFGTATLSFADGVKTAPGDCIEIESALFGQPLRNTLDWSPHRSSGPTTVEVL